MSRPNAAAGMPTVHPALSQANQAVIALEQQHQTAYRDLQSHTDGEIKRLSIKNFCLKTSNEELEEAKTKLDGNAAQTNARYEGLVKEKDGLHARVLKEQKRVVWLRCSERKLEALLSEKEDDATVFRVTTVVLLAESRRELLRLRKENANLVEGVAGADSNCEWFRDELARSIEVVKTLRKEQVVRVAEFTNEQEKLADEHASEVAKLKHEFKVLKAQQAADAAVFKQEEKRLSEDHSAKATQARQEVDQLREKKQAVEKNVLKKQSATEVLQAQLKESNSQVAVLRDEINTQANGRTTLQKAYDKLLADHRELQGDHNETKDSLAQSEKDKARLDNVLHQERETHRKKLDHLAYHQERVPEFQNAITILKTQVAAAKNLLAKLGPSIRLRRGVFGVLMHWLRHVNINRRARLASVQTKLVETQTQLVVANDRYASFKKAVLSVTHSMDDSERTPATVDSGQPTGSSIAMPAANEAVQQTVVNDVHSDHEGRPPITPVSPEPATMALSGLAMQPLSMYADHHPSASPLGPPNNVPLGSAPGPHQSASHDSGSSRGNKRPGPPRGWDDGRPRGPKQQRRSAEDQRRSSRW